MNPCLRSRAYGGYSLGKRGDKPLTISGSGVFRNAGRIASPGDLRVSNDAMKAAFPRHRHMGYNQGGEPDRKVRP